jgi:glycosyltransferase involved in cell wall biosynthesis
MKKNNKLILVTVIYDEISNFINEFIQSIDQQSFKNFEILVVNDCDKIDLIKKFKSKLKKKIHVIKGVNNGNLNRLNALKYLKKKKFNQIVFCDSDDLLHRKRIENTIEFFAKNKDKKIFCGNLVFIDQKDQKDLFFKSKVALDDILEFNMLGFGTLAIRSNLIETIIKIIKKCNSKILDWAIFLLLLKNDMSYVNVNKRIITYYRFHKNNLLGNPKKKLSLSEAKLLYKYKINFYQKIILTLNLKLPQDYKLSLIIKKKTENAIHNHNLIVNKNVGNLSKEMKKIT